MRVVESSIEQPARSRLALRSRLLLFFTLAFVLSWAFWLPAVALNLSIQTPAGRVLEIAGNFGPLLAALIAASAGDGWPGLRLLGQRLISWRVPTSTSLTALLLPFVMMGAAIAVNIALGGVTAESRGPGLLLGIVPIFLRNLFVTGGLNEETGWRGVALPGLLERFGAVRASVILGILWGLWHAPLYFLPGTGQNAMIRGGGSFAFLFIAFIVWTVGLSILFTWLYRKAGGSLWIMVLFHAAVNTAAGLPASLGIHAPMSSMLYAALTWVAAVIVSRNRKLGDPSRMRSTEQ